MPRSALAPSTAAPSRYRYRWLVFAVMLAGEVMDVLDTTIINVAGPSLENDLGATATQLAWAIGGYALAMGAGLIISGRLGDLYGRRRLFLIAIAAFGITSLLCAAAPSIDVLIAARFLQGAAGALLLPQGFALLRTVFRPDELGKALAIFGPVLGVAAIAGPVVGGALVQADVFGLGWRFALAVNVPITLAAWAIAHRFVPFDRPTARGERIDIAGALLVAVSSALLVFPLIQGQELGWPWWTWLCLVVAGTGFVAFALQQRSRVAAGRTPLVAPGVFTKPSFTAGIGGMALFFSGMIGIQLVLTLFLQLGHGFSAGEAGLAALPLAIGSFAGSALSGAVLLARIGKRVLQLGAVLQLTGCLWLWLVLEEPGFEFWRLVPALALSGLGSGLIIAALITIVISAVDDNEAGSGSGLLAAVQSISSAAGIALLTGVFFSFQASADATGGYQLALIVHAVLLAAFLLTTLLLPARPGPGAPLSG